MPITELLERNAKNFGDDVALVEVNPEIKETIIKFKAITK